MIEKSKFFSVSEEVFKENGLSEFAKPEIFEKTDNNAEALISYETEYLIKELFKNNNIN